MNNFNQYQDFTQSKAIYNTDVNLTAQHVDGDTQSRFWMPYMYPVLALAEEAGEVVGKVAKFIRKSNKGVTTNQVLELREAVRDELGDVMYQVSETARMFGWTLQQIIERNEDKLTDRQERGVLEGSGDNR